MGKNYNIQAFIIGASKHAKTIAPTPSANVPPIQAQVARGNHPTAPHVISKYEL